ncbi:MAG TPA: ABC transporter permease [Thermoanaerobaculia bacterium]|nr:ABC transporter permease [Thermoanaerobaculia bacterium]
MLTYNVKIALKSLRRNPVLTALLIGAIALGICVSTTFIALRHLFAKDPLPEKSHTLFYVRMDNWDPQRAYVAEDPKSLPTQITYRDAMALLKSDIPVRQTPSYKTRMFVHPDPKVGRPFAENVRVVYNDFFHMFNVPFEYGGPWDKAADAKPEQVIVLSQPMNEKLFGGGNSVGRSVRLEDRNYKVVGVLAEWRPSVKFFDMTQSTTQAVEGIYLPFNFATTLQLATSGNSDGWKGSDGTVEGFLASETVWLQYWVELPTPEKVAAYREFVDNHVRDQKRIGRFQRPLHTAVTPMPELMKEFNAVPPAVKSMSIVSILFLVVCSLNLVGLLLGKFLARIPEVSVRRALGASRLQVFWQHVVECELVGIAGGVIGILLSMGILRAIAKFAHQQADLVRLDGEMIVVSIFLSLVAGLLAGIYPAWRVCSVAPAMQLKVQ